LLWHSVAPAFQLSQDIKNQQHIEQKQNVEIFAEFHPCLGSKRILKAAGHLPECRINQSEKPVLVMAS